MTISAFAKERGLSNQAVYQRLKVYCEQNKVDYELLKPKNSPQLTEEGERVLRILFSGETGSNKEVTKQALSTASELIEANKQIEALKKQLEEAEKARDALTMQIDQQEKRIQQYTDRVQELETERDFLRGTIAQEQANHQQALAMLQPAKKEGGLFGWFRKRSQS